MTKKQSNSTEAHELKISDLEERLIQDKSGRFRDYLMSKLYDQMVELKNTQRQEQAPGEFDRTDSLVVALAAAGETVVKVWKKHHKKLLQPNP